MKNITDIVRALITGVTLVLGFAYFFLSAFVYDTKDAQITICVVNLMTLVFGYWLGSSLGSSKKQDTLDAIQKSAVAEAEGDPNPPSGPKGGNTKP